MPSSVPSTRRDSPASPSSIVGAPRSGQDAPPVDPESSRSTADAPRAGLFWHARLPGPPQWMKRTPWAVLGCTVLLAVCVLAFELGNLKKESEFTAQVTLEKGGALINALEGALQTGSGFHWTDEQLRALIQRVGRGSDIRALALVNAEGRVLLGMDGTTALAAGQGGAGDVLPLWQRPPPEGLHIVPLSPEQGSLRISRRIHVDSEDMHRGHGHGRARSVLGLAGPSMPLWVAVEYDMAVIDAARSADRTHRLIIGMILAFITFLGGMTWYLVRGYLRSRQEAWETSAFAGHIVRTLPAGVIAADADGRITVINPEALRITGMRLPQALGQVLSDIGPRLWPDLWRSLAVDLQGGTPLLDREMRCSFAGRAAVPLSVSAAPLYTENGEPLGHVLVMRDLGEIRRLQAELRRRDRLAALGTLAARVAHEVRNPLSAIRGIARYFEECHPAHSEDAALARTLGQEVLRLDKVVGELLDLARPDIIERKPVALDALVERARRMAEPALREQGVDFAAHVPHPAPEVMVDSDRMGQVLINLLLNAVDAMQDSARKRLTVRAFVDDSGPGEPMLHLEVEDSGCGISPDKVQEIFSPYYTTKPRGTGLGLSIVHKIVEAHEGIIEVKSGDNGGCVMTVRLPLPPCASPLENTHGQA